MQNLRVKAAFLFVLAFFLSTVGMQAQDKDDQPIKVNTVLVNIPVIASDRLGRYVAGLKKENFSIIQDGKKQEIEFFADEKAPMNVAILIDTSGSTRPFLDNIKSAAKDFVKIFRPEDQGMIVTFAGGMTVLQEFTSDQKKLSKAINQADLYGSPGSNMQDAMYEIVTRSFRGVRGRKAVIVLTDGFVEGKVISNSTMLSTLAESDILIYPILFGQRRMNIDLSMLPKTVRFRDGAVLSREDAIKKLEDMANAQLRFMDTLGPTTGGKLLESKSHDFKASFQNIADELKNQYTLGFYAANTGDGKSHSVNLSVNPGDIVIRTKRNIKLKGRPDN